jgi:hypothetical protein
MISRFEHGLSLPSLKVLFLLELALGTLADEIYVDLFQRMRQVLLYRADRLPPVVGRPLRERILRKDDL